MPTHYFAVDYASVYNGHLWVWHLLSFAQWLIFESGPLVMGCNNHTSHYSTRKQINQNKAIISQFLWKSVRLECNHNIRQHHGNKLKYSKLTFLLKLMIMECNLLSQYLTSKQIHRNKAFMSKFLWKMVTMECNHNIREHYGSKLKCTNLVFLWKSMRMECNFYNIWYQSK